MEKGVDCSHLSELAFTISTKKWQIVKKTVPHLFVEKLPQPILQDIRKMESIYDQTDEY